MAHEVISERAREGVDPYAAFVSYRHTEPDRRWAKWLQGDLRYVVHLLAARAVTCVLATRARGTRSAELPGEPAQRILRSSPVLSPRGTKSVSLRPCFTPSRFFDSFLGTTPEIHQAIRALADEGKAVVVISSYLPEVLSIADRILVARQGRIVEELSAEEATEDAIMYAAIH